MDAMQTEIDRLETNPRLTRVFPRDADMFPDPNAPRFAAFAFRYRDSDGHVRDGVVRIEEAG